MLIYFKRINTKWTLNIVNMSKCLQFSQTKSIHLSSFNETNNNKSDDKKEDKNKTTKTYDFNKRRSNLQSFSFIPLKKNEINKPKQQQQPSSNSKVKNESESKSKTVTTHKSVNKTTKFKIHDQREINPQAVLNLARLLDNRNPEKTAELITKPLMSKFELDHKDKSKSNEPKASSSSPPNEINKIELK